MVSGLRGAGSMKHVDFRDECMVAVGWVLFFLCVLAKSLQSCPTLCDPVDLDCSPPGSSVCGILRARILEWVASSPGDLPDPGIERASLISPALAGGFFTTSASQEAFYFRFCDQSDRLSHRHLQHGCPPVLRSASSHL